MAMYVKEFLRSLTCTCMATTEVDINIINIALATVNRSLGASRSVISRYHDQLYSHLKFLTCGAAQRRQLQVPVLQRRSGFDGQPQTLPDTQSLHDAAGHTCTGWLHQRANEAPALNADIRREDAASSQAKRQPGLLGQACQVLVLREL